MMQASQKKRPRDERWDSWAAWDDDQEVCVFVHLFAKRVEYLGKQPHTLVDLQLSCIVQLKLIQTLQDPTLPHEELVENVARLLNSHFSREEMTAA